MIDRTLPAPKLRETADIWWDSSTDPNIVWDPDGRTFWLVDGAGADEPRLNLFVFDGHDVPDPAVVAGALHEGLAACDFPPTEPGVPAHRARATLRAAGVDV